MNEILPFAKTYMEQESIMLSEISQKDKYHMISYVQFKKQQMNKAKKRQTKKQILNYREETDGYQKGGM